jgi:hypothetical protein
MKRRRVLGIEFLAGRRRLARAIDGAVEGWPMGGRETQPANKTTGLTAMISMTDASRMVVSLAFVTALFCIAADGVHLQRQACPPHRSIPAGRVRP